MNARDRLFAALNGEPTDHVPVWLLFPYHKTSYYVDVRNLPAWREVQALAQEKAITLNRRNPGVPLFTPEVKITRREESSGGIRTERTIWEWRDVRLYSEITHLPDETRIKKLIDNEDDLEAYCRLPVLTDRAQIEALLEARLAEYYRERKEFPLALGSMMLDLGEPVAPLYHSANLEEYAIWSLTCPELIDDLLGRFMQRLRVIYDYCLRNRLADLYFMVGSELAAPPLVGPETFARWIVPYSIELADRIHVGGARVVQHFHGQIKHLLPEFARMKADAIHTIEAPPVGNCTMTEAFAATGNKITLIGNIQYDDFCRWTPQRMREETIRLLDECRSKRLILSPTAGPFDATPPAPLLENYKVFLNTAWDYDWRSFA